MLYGPLKGVIGPTLRGLFRLEVEGVERIPTSGGVILAPNHQAFCDSLFIPAVVPRRVTFVAKAEYFEQRRTAWLFRSVGQIPMYREGGERSAWSLGEAQSLLERGGVLAIYPEGTRSPDERLYRGRTGVARLALATRCPVVPVGVLGTREVQPIGARLLRPFKPVTIRFGDPVDYATRYADRLDDPLVPRQVTDEIMFEIGQLTGQQYVDRYASRGSSSSAGAAAGQGGGGAAPRAELAGAVEARA